MAELRKHEHYWLALHHANIQLLWIIRGYRIHISDCFRSMCNWMPLIYKKNWWQFVAIMLLVPSSLATWLIQMHIGPHPNVQHKWTNGEETTPSRLLRCRLFEEPCTTGGLSANPDRAQACGLQISHRLNKAGAITNTKWLTHLVVTHCMTQILIKYNAFKANCVQFKLQKTGGSAQVLKVSDG